jgi:hypothetical protein
MSVAFGTIGATSNGTSSLATDYPASIAANDLLLHFAASKYGDSSHSVPSGFALLDGEVAGIGSNIADSGSVVASVHQKTASGSESGTEALTVTSGNVAQGMIARITRSGGVGFQVAATRARWATDSTNPLAVTFDEAVGFEPGDYVLVFVGLNANLTTGVTSPALTASGATFSAFTQRAFTTTATGGDMAVFLTECSVSSGSSSAVPSFQMTKSGSTQGEGPVLLVRVRENAGATPASAPPLASLAARIAPLFRF